MLAGSSSEVVQLGARIARAHHEHWDGGGYPLALAGEQIPLEGRIAAVADCFDALTSTRVYRPAFPVHTALETMQRERGTHFDPDVHDAFLEVLPELEPVRRTFGE
jgi:putative two-component system response regulator